MAFDDYEVVVYKVLAYLYECIKAGVNPSIDKAKELAKVNDVYWNTVLDGLLRDGFAAASVVYAWEGHTAIYSDLRITQKGAAYVKDSSKMREVARFLGKAFRSVLQVAVAATAAL